VSSTPLPRPEDEPPFRTDRPAPSRGRAAPKTERLRSEIAARLRASCAHMSPETFEALVDDIVQFKVRWADD
jgi:hypothetical protein